MEADVIEETNANDTDDFAARVLDAYTCIKKGVPFGPGVTADMLAVATPLAILHEALDVLQKSLVESPKAGRVKKSQIMPALHLLDCLVTGADHPVWHYFRVLQSSVKHRRPPGEVELLRRTMAVGVLRALMGVYGARSETKAAIKIQTECLKKGMKITVRQLTEWNTEFQTTRDPEPDACAKRFATDGSGRAIVDPDRIVFNGVSNLDEFYGKVSW